MDGSSYGYAGEWTDASGLQYLRARYYSPSTGRFISKDPFPGLLTQPASLTPYVYALNNPVLYSDPSGEFIDTLFDAVSVGYDIYTIGNKLKHGCALVWQDWAALGVDTFSLAVPFFPSVGGAALRLVFGGATLHLITRADNFGDLASLIFKTGKQLPPSQIPVTGSGLLRYIHPKNILDDGGVSSLAFRDATMSVYDEALGATPEKVLEIMSKGTGLGEVYRIDPSVVKTIPGVSSIEWELGTTGDSVLDAAHKVIINSGTKGVGKAIKGIAQFVLRGGR